MHSPEAPGRLPIVGVMGSGTDEHADRAEPLGRWLAHRDVHLLTGGGRGVMTATSRAFHGVAGRAGRVLGVLPGDATRGEAPSGYPNPYVEIPIRTHLPDSGRRGTEPSSRNHLNVLSADGIVALPGGAGTASEVALARHYGRPVVAFLEDRAELAGLPSEVPVRHSLEEVGAFLDEHLGPPATTGWRAPRGASDVAVRRLAPEDAATYQALRLRALQDTPSAFASSHEEERAYTTAFVAGRLAPDAPGIVFGAFDGDTLVGTTGLFRADRPKLAHRGEIWGVFVAPEARGRGVGHVLLTAALQHARDVLGLSHVTLGVHARNDPAIRLYRAHGFVEYGCERGFLVVDGVPQDEVLMRKSLRDA